MLDPKIYYITYDVFYKQGCKYDRAIVPFPLSAVSISTQPNHGYIYIYIYARLVSVAWLDLTIANSWYFFLFPLNRSHPTNYGNRAPRSPYWSRVNHALFSYVTVVVSRSPDTRSFDIASREGTVGFFSWPLTPWKPWKRPSPCYFSSLRTDSQPIRFNHELGLDVPLENESVRLLSLTRPFRKERYRRSKVINKASKMKAGYTDLGIHHETEKLFWDKKKRMRRNYVCW